MQKRYALVILILVSTLLFSACGTPSSTTPSGAGPSDSGGAKTQASSATDQPQYGGTLIWVRNAGITAVGAPADIPTQTGTYMALAPAFETLLLTDDQERIQPNLAESWEISPDGKTITLKLRKGVKFHDGTDFNAAAVKYNLEQVLAANASGSAVLKNVTSYDIVDDYTLRLNLAKHDARLLLTFAQTGIGMMASPTAMKKPTTPENMGKDHVVGTGPFKFDSWSKDQYIKFVKWDGYWQKGRPYLDAIEYRSNPNVAVSIMSFKAREVNMVENIDPADYVALKKEGFEVSIPNLAFVFSIVPDSANADSPFAKKQVREALEYAIDRTSLVEGIGKGTQNPAYQLASPTDPWFIKDLPTREYNVTKAKQLLAEAGYPNGFTYPIIFDVRGREDQVVGIQSYLKEVGINTTLDKADVARATTFTQNGWKGILVPGFPNWSAFSSWTNRFNNPTLTWPSQAVPDPTWRQKWDVIVAEPDFDKRMGLMKDQLKQIYDQALVIPYLWDAPRDVRDGTIRDMGWDTRHINGYADWANVWLKKK